MLILSTGLFAGSNPFKGQEKFLENHLEMTKRNLTDGNIQLRYIDYDVDIYENNIFVQLEVNTFSRDSNWSKFDKKTFEKLMVEIVAEVRNSISNQTIPVNISLELDKKMGADEIVYNKTF